MVCGSHMNDQNPIPLGRYRHFKGNDYSVVGFARHSETEETMVLYVPLYGAGGYWVRPLAMFTATVEVDSKSVPRFEYLGS
jgi:cyclomaltodextrinase